MNPVVVFCLGQVFFPGILVGSVIVLLRGLVTGDKELHERLLDHFEDKVVRVSQFEFDRWYRTASRRLVALAVVAILVAFSGHLWIALALSALGARNSATVFVGLIAVGSQPMLRARCLGSPTEFFATDDNRCVLVTDIPRINPLISLDEVRAVVEKFPEGDRRIVVYDIDLDEAPASARDALRAACQLVLIRVDANQVTFEGLAEALRNCVDSVESLNRNPLRHYLVDLGCASALDDGIDSIGRALKRSLEVRRHVSLIVRNNSDTTGEEPYAPAETSAFAAWSLWREHRSELQRLTHALDAMPPTCARHFHEGLVEPSAVIAVHALLDA